MRRENLFNIRLTSSYLFDIRIVMKLNIEKIDAELKRIGKSWYWISKQLQTSWQRVRYWRDTKCLKGAPPIAKIFNLDPKDLIK